MFARFLRILDYGILKFIRNQGGIMSGKKKMAAINPFALIFAVIVIAGLLVFIVQPGLLENGVYTPLEKNTFNFNNLFNIFRAIPYGLKDSANIMILIIIVGGALEIYKKSGAIDTGINSLISSFGKNSQMLMLAVLIIVFSAIGGFLGWIEVLIPFAPLMIAVVLALGFDAMTAVAVLIVSPMAGFLAGPTNLYTVGVANTIIIGMGNVPADYDVFTGLEFRLVVWSITTLIAVLYITRYARISSKNAERSLVKDIDVSDLKIEIKTNEKLTLRQSIVLFLILTAMIMTVIGMRIGFNGVKWSIDDISAVFFLSAILAGFVAKISVSDIANTFIKGASGAIGGALVVGFARGVFWVMNAGKINATIIYHLTNLLRGTSTAVTAVGIIFIVSLINGLIPSGSGKGALLMPILMPIAIELGLPIQTTVLAYQFGDGITNMFWFSYGTLLIFLSYGKVPVQKWYKFIIPLLGIFFIEGIIATLIAVNIGF